MYRIVIMSDKDWCILSQHDNWADASNSLIITKRSEPSAQVRCPEHNDDGSFNSYRNHELEAKLSLLDFLTRRSC
jgi:hypothetical protein